MEEPPINTRVSFSVCVCAYSYLVLVLKLPRGQRAHVMIKNRGEHNITAIVSFRGRLLLPLFKSSLGFGLMYGIVCFNHILQFDVDFEQKKMRVF